MRGNTDWDKLARYLAGESMAEEKRQVEAWLKEHPERGDLLNGLRRIWDASGAPRERDLPDRQEMDADRQRLLRAIRRRQREAAKAPDREPRRQHNSTMRRLFSSPRSHLMRVAAVLVLLIGGAFIASQFYDGSEQSASEPLFREITTRRGERATVELFDGSKVMLSVDSRLRLPETFGQNTREVRLEGEAYFDVASDSSRPFVVRSGGAVVRVMGTAFGVRAYSEADSVQVVVKGGSVALKPAPEAKQGAMLQPGQLGRLARGGRGRVRTQKVDPGDYLSWTEGRLVFENQPLPEVAARLERWYDIEIQLQSEALQSLQLSASLTSRSVPHVLEVITTTLDIGYQAKSDSTFVLTDG